MPERNEYLKQIHWRQFRPSGKYDLKIKGISQKAAGQKVAMAKSETEAAQIGRLQRPT